MALLAESPRYGYQLKTAFESATGGVWPLNVGQVYTTLDRLHRDGLVDVDDATGRSATRSPPAGAPRSATGGRPCPSTTRRRATSCMLKVLLAIDHGRDHALGVITRQRTALTRLLQQHRRAQPPGRRRRRWPRRSSPTRCAVARPRPTCAGSTCASPGSCGPADRHPPTTTEDTS